METSQIKKPKDVFDTIQAKHEFTRDEILDMSQKLALATQRINRLEEEKRQLNSDFKAKIDFAVADTNLLATNIANGFEMRATRCRIEFDPTTRTKSFYTSLTGEFVRNEEMTTADFQLHFPDFPQ